MSKRHVKYVLATLIGVGALYIAAKAYSIWFDESFTYGILQHDYIDIIRRTAHDVHPPLYYLLLKTWSFAFGDTIVALRSFGILTWVVALAGLYPLVKRFVKAKYHFVTWLFLGFMPQLMHYALEVRMYSLAMAVIIWSTELFLRVFVDKRPEQRFKILYALSLALALYTQYFASLIIVVHLAALLVTEQFEFKKFWTSVKSLWNKYTQAFLWVIAGLALYVPWAFVMVWQVMTVTNNGFWIETPTAIAPFESLNFITLGTKWAVGWLGFSSLLLMAALVYGSYTLYKKHDKTHASLLVGGVVLPFGIMYVLSMPPLTAVLYPRYVSMYGFFIGVVLVMGVLSLRKKLATLGLALLLVANLVGAYNTNNEYHNNGWFAQKEMTAYLDSGYLKPNEPLVAGNIFIYADLEFGGHSRWNTAMYFKDKIDYIGQYSAFNTDKFLVGNTVFSAYVYNVPSFVTITNDTDDLVKYMSQNTQWRVADTKLVKFGRTATRYVRR